MIKRMTVHYSSRKIRALHTLLLLILSPLTFADVLHITGCGVSKKAYLERAIQVYTEQNQLIPRLSGGGATKGLHLAASNQVDIGAPCRQRLADIGGNIHEKEKDINLIQVGWDALVVIVNKGNPLSDMSHEDLIKVFNGNIKNWVKLGVEANPITLLTRKEKTSGVGYMARLLIFGDKDFEYQKSSFVYDSTGPIEKNVQRRKNSIALGGLSSAQKLDVKILGINGIYPSKQNVTAGKYPFFRPLYLAVNKHNKSNKVKGFVDFVLGQEGQKIISNEGAINLHEGQLLVEKWHKISSAMGSLYQETLIR